jgi:hypothetical protein
MVGSNLTIKLTAAGMDTPKAQAKRLTDIEAMSENCGEYIRLLVLVYIGIPPKIRYPGSQGQG